MDHDSNLNDVSFIHSDVNNSIRMPSSAEQRAESFRVAMQGVVDDLDKRHLRPLQKTSYECMARCCDTAEDTAALQNCCHDCERKVQLAEKTVQLQLNDFQSRLQRCIQRCQDSAQESLPSQPKDSDVSKAQDKLANCAADCAAEYERQIPKLQRGISDRLSSIR